MKQTWFRARTPAALGSALAEIRQASGMSQTDAAEKLGSSRPTISRMERGQATSTYIVTSLLAATSYEILLVPRGSRVVVETP